MNTDYSYYLINDGKLLISILIVLNLGTIFIKDKRKFIISNLSINLSFIITIIAMTLTQRLLVFIDFEAVEAAYLTPILADFLYLNSDKFIMIGLFLLLNLIITYKKLVLVKTEET